jgi:hypothetical protein
MDHKQSTLEELVYHWSTGSLPPPHHYEYSIRLKPTCGRIEYSPDYPAKGVPVIHREFRINSTEWDRITVVINQVRRKLQWDVNEPPRIGGNQEWLDCSFNDGSINILPDLGVEDRKWISSVYDSIRSLVPEEIWSSLENSRTDYYKKRNETAN